MDRSGRNRDPMAAGVGLSLMAVWPILDQERTRAQLVAEALDDLPLVAERTRCRVTGDPAWQVLEGREVPGWAAVELVLVCHVPAVRLRAVPVSSPTAHIETIRRLAGDGWTDARIADYIGCSESGVTKVRQRKQIAAGTAARRAGAA